MHNCLPEEAIVTVRKHTESVDGSIFASFATRFAEHVKAKTTNGRKFVLTCDGHEIHLTGTATETLRNASVIAYCLPAHTRGKTRPLDVGLYGPFKNAVTNGTRQAVEIHNVETFEQFDLLHIMHAAYDRSFSKDNIVSAFKKSDMLARSCWVSRIQRRLTTLTVFLPLMSSKPC